MLKKLTLGFKIIPSEKERVESSKKASEHSQITQIDKEIRIMQKEKNKLTSEINQLSESDESSERETSAWHFLRDLGIESILSSKLFKAMINSDIS